MSGKRDRTWLARLRDKVDGEAQPQPQSVRRHAVVKVRPAATARPGTLSGSSP